MDLNYEQHYTETYKTKVRMIEDFVLKVLKTHDIEPSELESRFLRADISFLVDSLETENRKLYDYTK